MTLQTQAVEVQVCRFRDLLSGMFFLEVTANGKILPVLWQKQDDRMATRFKERDTATGQFTLDNEMLHPRPDTRVFPIALFRWHEERINSLATA